jgi:iron(III) transport system substrate-binding protein
MRRLVVAAAFLILGAATALAAEVNVYTTREPGLIKPLFDAFTAKTGITVNAIFVEQGLAERVEAEGQNSPADLLTVVDYGNLIDLVERGLTQPVELAVLEQAIPANLRDPDGNWFSLSVRARVI